MRFNAERSGYTLVEAIVVFMIVAILSFGIGSFIVSSVRLWAFVSGRQSATKISQAALNRMVNEIKKIPRGAGLLKMTTSEVQFTNYDSANSIDFQQNGSNLLRISGSNNNILAAGLLTPAGKGLTFTYLNSSEAVTANSQEVRSVRVLLSLAAGGQTVTLETSARIRAYEIRYSP